ncbi:Transcriptional regulator, LysR family [Kosakonia radicincitans]|uniref:LysR family transcriptional regulator n=1 Tax=Kosakonia radicincitans TaxID=283686 RepID=UPI001181E48D|nr:LysR family transcriptional regulator [Kosakonia radicincitans]VVT53494.1 Transcriptional regulator, LysR family [Kosakonia radicincitans]
MDWQDLHFFFALSRCGSLSAAARELGVDHATVSRRITALESSLGLRLTERLPRRTTLTGHGRIIASGADEMYRIADRIRIQARSLCAEPAVPINISASPAVAAHLIAPAIAGFTRKHPAITLSLSGVSHHALLNKSEADIAVRLERPDDPDLMTRRIGTMRFGLYASQFWQEIPQEDWVFIAYDSTLAHVTQQQWLESLLNGRRVIFRASDLMAQQQAARKGLGIVTLPCFMGDNDSELVRLQENLPSPVRNIWLVAYPELKRDHSAVVVMDFLAEIIGRSCPPGKNI